MLQRTPSKPDPLRLHEAGYRVAARELGIEIRGARRPLRCFVGDLQWPPRDLEVLATIALCGRAALARHGLDGLDRDWLLAGDLILAELAQRFGQSAGKAFVREYCKTRLDEIAERAEMIVADHWSEITAEAARRRSQKRAAHKIKSSK